MRTLSHTSRASRTGRSASRLIAATITLLLALTGLTVIPATAQAAAGDIANATLDWGVKSSWRGYIANGDGGTTFTGSASASPAPYRWGTTGVGSYNPSNQTGSFTAPGGVNWSFPGHTINLTIDNLVVAFDLANGTGTITGTYEDPARPTPIPTTTDTLVNFTTVGATVTTVGNTVTVTGAPATAAAGTADAFGAFYPPGTAMDPISFSFDFETATTATTTTLATLPASITHGTQLTLNATVSPAAAAGSVEFFDGATSLGSEPVVSGTASLAAFTPALGAHSFTAVFTSSDAAYTDSSTTSASVVTVNSPSTAEATTTTMNATTPADPVQLGDSVTLSASVVQSSDPLIKPTGTIEFFAVAAGTTTEVSLGTATVDASGTATLATTALTAGGHSFLAKFTPEFPASFQTSQVTDTTNYRVVDTALATHCTVPNTVTADPGTASATWSWSQYFINMSSFNPVRSGTGDVTVSGTDHVFSNGVIRATAECAEISFTGTARLTLHSGTNWVEIEHPTLFIHADGSSVWSAVVRSWSGGNTFVSANPVTIAAGSTGASITPGDTVAATVNFNFADTVPQGTWHANHSDAWANSFLWNLDPAQRAYYTRTSASASQGTKGAAPLTVNFTWPAISSTTLAVTPAAPQLLGDTTTLTASVAPAAGVAGTVEFFDTPATTNVEVSLGTANVVAGAATLSTSTLAAGGHSFRAVFTSSNAFTGSESAASANYGIVDATQPALCVPAAGTSETFTGVTADWDWSAYSSGWVKVAGGNVTVNGQTFTLSDGIATVSANCTSIAFTGTLRIEAYQSFFPPHGQWVELVDPVLTIDSSGTGAWSAGVRSGTATLNQITSAPTVIAAVDSASSLPDFTQDSVNTQVDLAYANTTAAGTWHVHAGTPRTNAWSNAFILKTPSAVRSFFYESSASSAQAQKPPAPITIDWGLAAPSGTVEGLSSGAEVLQGQTITLSAGQFRAGDVVSAVVHSTPVPLPQVTVGFNGVASWTWQVPANFELGAHQVVFTKIGGATARTVTTPFRVNALNAPPKNTDLPCVARAVTGGNMNWEFRQEFKNYVQGPIAQGTFSGGSFTATGGAINVNEGGIGRVNFQGSITATGHSGALDLQLVNPSVQITGPNSGVLYGTLTHSGTGGSMAIANLTFSSVSFSGNTLTVVGSSASLTGSAAAAFNGFYGAGTSLDPVSFTVTLGGEVPCDNTTDPKLALTGTNSELLPTMIGLAALALLLGFGLLRARRQLG